MKTLFRIIPVLLVPLLWACTGLSKTETMGPFERRSWTESVTIHDSGSENGVMNLSFRLLDVSQSGALQNLLRTLLYEGKSAGEYARSVAAQWEADYRDAGEDYDDEYPFIEEWFYEEEQNITLAGTYAHIGAVTSEYAGGAHPNWVEKNFVLDTENPRQLTLADIVESKDMPKLLALMERELRLFSEEMSDEPLPPGTPLSKGIYFEDTVKPSDFYPIREGIVFQWDPYEIAPYAAGGVEVNVNWEELQSILSPEGKKLAAAFGYP